MSVDRIALVLLVWLLGASIAHAECPRYTAPNQFENPADWGNDSGPVVGGFVDSKRQTGAGVFDLIHGVDLDSYNDVDYSKIVECSGKFAIVRINSHKNSNDSLDTRFGANIEGLAKQNITAFPYYYLSLPPDLKTISQFNRKLSDTEKAEFVRKFESVGALGAQRFLQLMANARYTVPTIDIAGLRGQFISVDVEERPLDESQAQQIAKTYYATFYSAAVCSWIKTVAATHRELIPLLYTFPGIYGEYLQFAEPEASACLGGLPVWIARTYANGWEAIRNTDTAHCKARRSVCATDAYVEKLCEIPGGNRCVIHQYTHRGTNIAIGATTKGGIPPHIDFDRFYRSKIVSSNLLKQYVRVEDAFKQ